MYSTQFISDERNHPTKQRGLLYRRKKLKASAGSITINLTSQHILSLNVLGKCKDAGMTISLKATHSNYTFTDFEKEIEVAIDERDKELDCIIFLGKNTFKQKIKIVSP